MKKKVSLQANSWTTSSIGLEYLTTDQKVGGSTPS